jgi:thiosulfate/3-mercaptopyruvate sulfurtransferase
LKSVGAGVAIGTSIGVGIRAAMGAPGVVDDYRVVLYDNMGSSWAARVWWMLRWIGFYRAALLDGGLSAWPAAGGELATEPVLRTARTLTVNLRPELIADQEEVRASIDDDARCIDAARVHRCSDIRRLSRGVDGKSR